MSEFSLSEFIFELPSTEEFLINVPLYKSFETNFINIDRVKEYVNYRGPIDLFCTECNQLSVFKSNRPVGTDDGRTGKKAAIDRYLLLNTSHQLDMMHQPFLQSN